MTEIPEVYLQPGEWEFVVAPTVLKTVLGSCVGITFRAPRLGIAAMCHPMLPQHPKRPPAPQIAGTAGRYVDSIIGEMIRNLDEWGARRNEVEVKLFGGADVLVTERTSATVGKMNADTAVRILAEEGFRLAASRLGGSQGVFIQFHTGTGEVLLRRLNQMETTTLAQSSAGVSIR